jgi:vacuole morphology and inheritance protein 14
MLTQLDRLVQLLESPIFTFLRMELLDGDNDLISAMYGILMVLPQSDAFNLVRGRLECIPKISKNDKLREAKKQKRKKFLNEIDFPSLLEHFQEENIKCREEKNGLVPFYPKGFKTLTCPTIRNR